MHIHQYMDISYDYGTRSTHIVDIGYIRRSNLIREIIFHNIILYNII